MVNLYQKRLERMLDDDIWQLTVDWGRKMETSAAEAIKISDEEKVRGLLVFEEAYRRAHDPEFKRVLLAASDALVRYL